MNYDALKFNIWNQGEVDPPGVRYMDAFAVRNQYQTMPGFMDICDVCIWNNEKFAWWKFSDRPATQWEEFTIPLNGSNPSDGQWVLDNATSLQDVLSNVTRFEIRADYMSKPIDQTGLDNVELVSQGNKEN